MENIIAKFQMLDNYVKEYRMELNEKINSNTKIDLNCKLGYGIQDIREEKNLIGQTQIVYEIILSKNQENVGKINLTMEALFEANKEIGKDRFEEMLKYNGATTLSQLCRAYIVSNTALSNMPIITLPMINFKEYFKNSENNQKFNWKALFKKYGSHFKQELRAIFD